jgi:hypothetical protein
MGRLSTRGFSESEANQINAKWELKTGEIFDEGYFAEFYNKHLGEILRETLRQRSAQGKAPPNVKTELKPDRKTLTVDVTVVMSN